MSIYQKLAKVNVLFFDVDGVFTNSLMHASEDGDLTRLVHTRDGLAVKKAIAAGKTVGIITKGNSQGVYKRFEGLGVEHIHMNMKEKIKTYETLRARLAFNDDEVLYMGDDISDLEVMRQVGVAACPADACSEVLEEANYIAAANGGYGCAREIIEKVLRLSDQW